MLAVQGARTWEEVASPLQVGGSPEKALGPGGHPCPLDGLKCRAMGTSRRVVTDL